MRLSDIALPDPDFPGRYILDEARFIVDHEAGPLSTRPWTCTGYTAHVSGRLRRSAYQRAINDDRGGDYYWCSGRLCT